VIQFAARWGAWGIIGWLWICLPFSGVLIDTFQNDPTVSAE